MKVKLFRMYGSQIAWNYSDDYADVPLSVGVTEWEEINNNDFTTLKNAIIQFNNSFSVEKKDYNLVIICDHDIGATTTIKNELKRLSEQAAEYKRKRDKRLEENRKKKDAAQLKKLNKQKLHKKELLEKLKRELGEE